MTTIKLKNGSGAPTAGDLVQGEPALDLTNKRLYTEDSGGTVIEVGTNPTSVTTGAITSTGIDVTGVVEATGYLAVEGTSGNTGAGTDRWIGGDGTAGTWFYNVPTGSNHYFAVNNTNKLAINSTGIDVTGSVVSDGLTVANTAVIAGDFDGGTAATYIRLQDDTDNFLFGSNNSLGNFLIKNETADALRLSVANTGDISFYEDTGTTAKLLWSAADESLTLTGGGLSMDVTAGTVPINIDTNISSTEGSVDILKAKTINNYYSGVTLVREGSTNTGLAFKTTGSGAYDTRMTIDSSGNVGIGTSSPAAAKFSSTPDGVFNLSGDKPVVYLTEEDETDSNVWMGLSNEVGIIGNTGDGLAFRTGASTATERMRLDSSGNLLVGGTSYEQAGSIGFKGTGEYSSILSSGAGGEIYAGGAIALVSNGYQISVTTGNAQTYKWHNGTTRSMTLDSSGNLLVGKTAIGTTTDGFEARASGYTAMSDTSGAALNVNRNGTDGDLAIFYKDGSTVGSVGTVLGDLYVGQDDTNLVFNAGGNQIIPAGASGANRDAQISLGDSGVRFKDLYLSGGVYWGSDQDASNNTTTNGTDIIQGNIRIASTSYCLDLNRANATDGELARFRKQATQVGGISVTGSSTSYNTSSDYRLKENVVAMSGATERLKQLNPSRFNFIGNTDTTVDGFLAHEVADVVPEAITGAKDAMRDEEYEVTPAVLDDDGNVVTEAVMGTRSVPDYQGIDQSKLVPLLVATIQELEARIAALESN